LAAQKQDLGIAIDGKALRRSKRKTVVAALLQREKIVIAQGQIDQKSNEITVL